MEHSIGTQLRHARERRDLSVAQVAEAVRLRPSVIQWFESDDFTPCGPAAYVRGYLRSLASYLDLPADDIIAEYARLYQPPPPSALPRTEVTRRRRATVATTSDGSASRQRASNSDQEQTKQQQKSGSAPGRRTPRRTARSQAPHVQQPDGQQPETGSAGDGTPMGSRAARRWLPMMWFTVVLLVVAALGYSLIASDARHRTSVPSTSSQHSQLFSPSPAPFAVDRMVTARMPATLRA